MNILLLLFCLFSVSAAQRFNPDFNMMPEGQYYKQIYDTAMRDIDQGYQYQRQVVQQNSPDMEKDRDAFRKWLMDQYQNDNARTDQFGNLMAGDKDAPLFLTCNGQGCNARG